MNLGARLKAERERLGFSQTDFAALAGASKHSQINWEKGAAAPNAIVLAAWAAHGLDVLYVVTGGRDHSMTSWSNSATSRHLTETANPVTNEGTSNVSTSRRLRNAEPVPVDAERLARIAELLESSAKQAGRRWPVKKLIAVAAEVYNALGTDSALEEPQVERILKLVVNR